MYVYNKVNNKYLYIQVTCTEDNRKFHVDRGNRGGVRAESRLKRCLKSVKGGDGGSRPPGGGMDLS